MLRISGWKRQSVRKLAKPKNENSKTPIAPRNRTNQKRNESLSKTESILRAYKRQVNQHLMISKESFLFLYRFRLNRFQPIWLDPLAPPIQNLISACRSRCTSTWTWKTWYTTISILQWISPLSYLRKPLIRCWNHFKNEKFKIKWTFEFLWTSISSNFCWWKKWNPVFEKRSSRCG